MFWSSPLLLFETLWLATKLCGSPVACEVSYLRNPLDEGRQVRVKKQLAVISWFPDLVFMKPWKTHGVKKRWESFSVKMFLSPYQPLWRKHSLGAPTNKIKYTSPRNHEYKHPQIPWLQLGWIFKPFRSIWQYYIPKIYFKGGQGQG